MTIYKSTVETRFYVYIEYMTYCTSENIKLYETDIISMHGSLYPTPVCPIVFCLNFVHPDNEEGSSGIVIQRETTISHPLVLFVCPYQRTMGNMAVIMAEVLSTTLLVILIFTSEVKCLAFHSCNSFGFGTDQSCQPE